MTSTDPILPIILIEYVPLVLEHESATMLVPLSRLMKLCIAVRKGSEDAVNRIDWDGMKDWAH